MDSKLKESIPDIIKDLELAFEGNTAFDSAEVAKQIKEDVESGRMRERMIQSAIKMKRNRRWEKIVKRRRVSAATKKKKTARKLSCRQRKTNRKRG